jgi:hypothetical protein
VCNTSLGQVKTRSATHTPGRPLFHPNGPGPVRTDFYRTRGATGDQPPCRWEETWPARPPNGPAGQEYPRIHRDLAVTFPLGHVEPSGRSLESVRAEKWPAGRTRGRPAINRLQTRSNFAGSTASPPLYKPRSPFGERQIRASSFGCPSAVHTHILSDRLRGEVLRVGGPPGMSGALLVARAAEALPESFGFRRVTSAQVSSGSGSSARISRVPTEIFYPSPRVKSESRPVGVTRLPRR